MVQPVRNRCFVKPEGGFWTSTWRDGASAWVDACEDMFGNAYQMNWFLVTPDPAARVLVIDCHADLCRILGKYPCPLAGTSIVWPDFEAIVAEYDALHLTAHGQHRTRLSYPHNLYGWDSECTLWFRWKFREVQQIPTPAVPCEAEIKL
jgi:hypothetical protein